jgi:hypothetical protein
VRVDDDGGGGLARPVQHAGGHAGTPHALDGKIKILSVAGLLANVIRAVFTDDSVSDIFAGEHQLF